MTGNPLEGLAQELQRLPSIGPKSALRMAFFFLSLSKGEVAKFVNVLTDTRARIRYCTKCFNISFTEVCGICNDLRRVEAQLCIVAEPRDVFAIERIGEYKGLYHVLGGLISPIDNIHPETLRIQELIARLEAGGVSEIILAINPTIEGDATLLYLKKIIQKFKIKKTKLAHGLPVGSDIDYADEITLQKAFVGRTEIDNDNS
ncbi:recombination mediator RecR [Candidatus Margulisiibacteriota bacterium]